MSNATQNTKGKDMTDELKAAIATYCSNLTAAADNENISFHCDYRGRKYVRIVRRSYGQDSAHNWLERPGEKLQPRQCILGNCYSRMAWPRVGPDYFCEIPHQPIYIATGYRNNTDMTRTQRNTGDENMTTTSLPRTINGRILTKGLCTGGCNNVIEIWVKPGAPLCCGNCRDRASRDANGWTPENSVD